MPDNVNSLVGVKRPHSLPCYLARPLVEVGWRQKAMSGIEWPGHSKNLMENSSFQKSHCNVIRSQGRHLENIRGKQKILTKNLASFFKLCKALYFLICFPSEWIIGIYTGSRNQTDLEKNLKACLLFIQNYILLIIKFW